MPGSHPSGSSSRSLAPRRAGSSPVVSQRFVLCVSVSLDLPQLLNPSLGGGACVLDVSGAAVEEVNKHWDWLVHNLLHSLSVFENKEDVASFVRGKVKVRDGVGFLILECSGVDLEDAAIFWI